MLKFFRQCFIESTFSIMNNVKFPPYIWANETAEQVFLALKMNRKLVSRDYYLSRPMLLGEILSNGSFLWRSKGIPNKQCAKL